jgi:hypothetical protein
MDEGWTRFVLEKQVLVPYVTLHDADIQEGALRSRFDAIVLPDQAPAHLLNGHPPGGLPDEFTEGLGKAGAARLREFVEEGGTLVALNAASLFVIEELGLPVKNVAAGTNLYCPGALLNTRVEGTSPLAHGLEPETPIWFEGSPAFEAPPESVVLRYPPANVLASGFLQGDAVLHGRSALVELRVGRGRVVLFGFRPQYRAQSWATYVAFFNSLYTSAAALPVP